MMHKTYSLRFVISILWLGFVLAISFMEAPLKFQAPSVSLPVGLDIGKLIFSTLNKIEWVFLGLVSAFSMVGQSVKKSWILCITLTVILLLQTFYLLPILDERAVEIIAGNSVEESNVHFYYVGIEFVKVIVLIITTSHFIAQNNKVLKSINKI